MSYINGTRPSPSISAGDQTTVGHCSSVIRTLATQTGSPGFKTACSLAAQTRSPGLKTADFSYPLITMYDTLKQVFHTRQSELWRSTVVLCV